MRVRPCALFGVCIWRACVVVFSVVGVYIVLVVVPFDLLLPNVRSILAYVSCFAENKKLRKGTNTNQ